MVKKVLLISSNSSGRGGGERYLVFLSRGLRMLNCEVHALLSDVPYMDVWAQALIVEGVIVHRYNLIGLTQRPLRFIQALSDARQIKLISDFCKKIEADAILVNQQYDEDGLDFLMGAIKAGIAPVAGVMHMPMTRGKNQRRLGRLRGAVLSHWYRRHPYHLIFVSEGAQKEFESYYSLSHPTFVVNNSTPLDINSSKNYLEQVFSDKSPVIGFVGQFCYQKNMMEIIKVWMKARGSVSNCKLLLVGDGPERSEIEEFLAVNFPSGSYYITGWTETPEVYYELMNVFILASRFEGLPLSLVEAASRGVPSVVSSFNGASDVAKIASWVKVANNDTIEEMSDLVISLLMNGARKPTDLELEDFRNYFSLERMAKETLQVFDAGLV